MRKANRNQTECASNWQTLPDTVEAIERGKLTQAELFPEPLDHTKAGRLRRLLGLPGVALASDLAAELTNWPRPEPWELADAAEVTR